MVLLAFSKGFASSISELFLSALGGFVGISYLAERTDTGQRLKFGLRNKPNIAQCVLRGSAYVSNNEVLAVLRSRFDNDFGGVHVMYSPPSTGKTTYLRQEAQHQVGLKTQNIIYMPSGIKNCTELHKALNIKPWWLPLSSVFNPVKILRVSLGRPKTVLVLDHQDHARKFGDSQKEMLQMLATDSMLACNYHTIVVVSDLDRAEAIMKLNEGNNFHKLGTASMFRWLPEHIHEFIERAEVLQRLPQDTKEEITKLGIEAGTCGFMYSLCAYFSQKGKGSTVVPQWMRRHAKEYASRWRAAAKWDDYSVGNPYLQ